MSDRGDDIRESLSKVEQEIGYCFTDISWLVQAVTHPSVNIHNYKKKGDRQASSHNYERLEFLGDRVIGLIIADMLFEHFPNEDEGSLARRHAELVCKAALYRVAKEINLGNAIIMSESEKQHNGKHKKSTLSNACEALIAALYKDGGIKAAEKFVRKFWTRMLESAKIAPKDVKSALQEWAQSRGLALPVYNEIERTGSAHEPVFKIEVTIDEGKYKAQGEAGSKKQAEKIAAERLLSMVADADA